MQSRETLPPEKGRWVNGRETTPISEALRIEAQPGPQSAFLSSSADVVIFGGAAGGSKSFSLLLEAMYDWDNSEFGGVIFRRTSPQLTGAGSLWSDSKVVYRGATHVKNPLVCTFPAGGTMQFLHLQYEDDVSDHQGKQYAYIGFDELTHFEESQFWYMTSRLRTTSGAMTRVRGTCNPDPDSFVRKLIAWWIGDPDCDDCASGECELEEHGLPVPERSGVLRWFIRDDDDTLQWFDTETSALRACTRKGQKPKSLTFIGSKLADNKALTDSDPGYEGTIEALPVVERRRLGEGNWNIRHKTGTYVSNDMFERRWHGSIRDLPPMNIYLCSDYAVTEPSEANKKPDFTEHGVFGIDAEDDIYVLDWWCGQTKSDVWIEEWLRLIKKWDPITAFGERGVIQKAVEPTIKKRMRETRTYTRVEWLSTSTGRLGGSSKEGFADRSKQAKAARGRPFQARANMGKIIFHRDAKWSERVRKQVVRFPQGPDDAFDVISHLCQAIDRAHGAIAPPPKRRDYRRDYGEEIEPEESWKTV